MTSITRQLAACIATHPVGEVSELRLRAGRIIADTVASIVSGAGSEIAPALLQYARATPGAVPLLGTRQCAAAETAALVNGSFGHALEFDDVFSMLPGHPAAVMMAAVLPDIHAGGVTARALNDAFIIGYETCARLGIAMTLEHHRVRGFHATATLGLFAGVAALARLRRLDTDATLAALSVAASLASGLMGQIGSEMKPVHSGWAARSAVAALNLAAVGLHGAADILAGPKGFFNAYGTAASQVERVAEHFGAPWVILEPGVSLKKFPCCFAAHRAIDAILQLRAQHSVTLDQVAVLECALPPKGLLNMIWPRPTTGLQAKFSMEYCCVATLADGLPGLATFTDAAVARPEIQARLADAHMIEDPACESEAGEAGLGEASGMISGARGHVRVTLVLHDGRRLEARVAHAPGTPARPLTDAELDAKFAECARHAGLSPAQGARLREVLNQWRRHDASVLQLADLWDEPALAA